MDHWLGPILQEPFGHTLDDYLNWVTMLNGQVWPCFNLWIDSAARD